VTARKSNCAACLGWRRWLSLAKELKICAILTAFVPSIAFAGQSARLVYSRTAEAATCSDESGLRKAVARRLGYDPFVAASMNTVVAELRGDGEGLKARVYVIRDGNLAGGARELASANRNCTELIAAVALAMSIAIDPDSLDRVEQSAASAPDRDAAPENANAPPTESTTEPTPNNIKPTSDVPRADVASKNDQRASLNQPVANLPQTSPRLAGSLGLSGFVASGFAPAPSFGVGLAGGLLVNRHWALSLEPQVTGPSSHPSSLGPSIRVSTWSYGASLALGYQSEGWYGGALFDAGQIVSKGIGVTGNTDSSRYTAAGLRFAYRWSLNRHWALVPRADALFAFNTLNIRINGHPEYDTRRLVGRFGLALEYQF